MMQATARAARAGRAIIYQPFLFITYRRYGLRGLYAIQNDRLWRRIEDAGFENAAARRKRAEERNTQFY